jgi:hypothetical protein
VILIGDVGAVFCYSGGEDCDGGVGRSRFIAFTIAGFRIGLNVEWGGQILENKAGVDNM